MLSHVSRDYMSPQDRISLETVWVSSLSPISPSLISIFRIISIYISFVFLEIENEIQERRLRKIKRPAHLRVGLLTRFIMQTRLFAARGRSRVRLGDK